jgi:hypothetical protein
MMRKSVTWAKPFQFHLADLLRWMTMLCIFLALGAALIPRFRQGKAPNLYSPSVEEILVESLGGAICVAGPCGVIATGTFWLILMISDFPSSFRLAVRDPLTWIVVMWGLIFAGILVCIGGPAGTAVVVLTSMIAGFAGPVFASALVLRGCGFRLQKVISPAPAGEAADKR